MCYKIIIIECELILVRALFYTDAIYSANERSVPEQSVGTGAPGFHKNRSWCQHCIYHLWSIKQLILSPFR